MRNLLEEFHSDHGLRPPTILGVREHVFTGRYVFLKSFDCVLFTLGFVSFAALCNISINDAVSHLWHHLCPVKKLVL